MIMLLKTNWRCKKCGAKEKFIVPPIGDNYDFFDWVKDIIDEHTETSPDCASEYPLEDIEFENNFEWEV